MAGRGIFTQELGGDQLPSVPYNGYDRETAILDSSGASQSLEEMLKEATDLQSHRAFNSGRLELRSDENESPFQQHVPIYSSTGA